MARSAMAAGRAPAAHPARRPSVRMPPALERQRAGADQDEGLERSPAGRRRRQPLSPCSMRQPPRTHRSPSQNMGRSSFRQPG